MPRLIRCISDYFDEERRDMYYIEFYELKGKSPSSREIANNEARNMILDWLETNMPAVKVEPIFNFTWKNAGATGYEGIICVHFDSKSLEKFVAHWEDGNDNSIDERFRLWWTPMWLYLEWNDGKMPERPNFEDY